MNKATTIWIKTLILSVSLFLFSHNANADTYSYLKPLLNGVIGFNSLPDFSKSLSTRSRYRGRGRSSSRSKSRSRYRGRGRSSSRSSRYSPSRYKNRYSSSRYKRSRSSRIVRSVRSVGRSSRNAYKNYSRVTKSRYARTRSSSSRYSASRYQNTARLRYLDVRCPSRVQENSRNYCPVYAVYSNGKRKNVTHQTRWRNYSRTASISGGYLRAGSVSRNQRVSFRASYAGRSRSLNVYILNKTPTITKLELSCPSTVQESSSSYCPVYARYSDGTRRNVTRYVRWRDSSRYASISRGGRFNAGSVNRNERVRVYAYYGRASATKWVTIKDQLALKDLQVTCPSNDVLEGKKVQCKAIATYANNTKKDVTNRVRWLNYSRHSSLSRGLVTARQVNGDQRARIRAYFREGRSSFNRYANLTIKDVRLKKIAFSGCPSTINENEVVSGCKVIAVSTDGTQKDITSLVKVQAKPPIAHIKDGKILPNSIDSDQAFNLITTYTENGVKKDTLQRVSLKNEPDSTIDTSNLYAGTEALTSGVYHGSADTSTIGDGSYNYPYIDTKDKNSGTCTENHNCNNHYPQFTHCINDKEIVGSGDNQYITVNLLKSKSCNTVWTETTPKKVSTGAVYAASLLLESGGKYWASGRNKDGSTSLNPVTSDGVTYSPMLYSEYSDSCNIKATGVDSSTDISRNYVLKVYQDKNKYSCSQCIGQECKPQITRCYGTGCDGKDPILTGCYLDAITDSSKELYENGIQVATMNYRWSPSCQTNWTQILTQNSQIKNLSAEIKREDGAHHHATIKGTYVYTPMLYAPKDCSASSTGRAGLNSNNNIDLYQKGCDSPATDNSEKFDEEKYLNTVQPSQGLTNLDNFYIKPYDSVWRDKDGSRIGSRPNGVEEYGFIRNITNINGYTEYLNNPYTIYVNYKSDTENYPAMVNIKYHKDYAFHNVPFSTPTIQVNNFDHLEQVTSSLEKVVVDDIQGKREACTSQYSNFVTSYSACMVMQERDYVVQAVEQTLAEMSNLTEDEKSELRKILISFGLDMIPVVGTIKAGGQLILGKDLVTGEKVNRAIEAVGLIPYAKIEAIKGSSNLATKAIYFFIEKYNKLKSTTKITYYVGHKLGDWRRFNVSIDDAFTIRQSDNYSCGQACGSMILKENGINVDPDEIGKGLTTFSPNRSESLINQINDVAPNLKFFSGFADNRSEALILLGKTGSWIAELKSSNSSIGHAVVIDLVDHSKKIITIRDPWDKTKYNMNIDDFMLHWSGAFLAQ